MRAVMALVVAALLVGCAVLRIGSDAEALDVNAADVHALAALPGLGRDDATRIIANRPYAAKDDLLRRGVLTPEQYAGVADHLYVGSPGMPDYLRAVPPQPEAP